MIPSFNTQGTKIQASIFGDDIEILGNTLQLFTAYSISNAVVKCIPVEHCLVIYEYQWTISARTCIEEISDDQLTIHKFTPDFVELTDLEHYDQPPQDINVLFAVLQAAPTRKIKLKSVRDNARADSSLQEAVIIDQCMKPIILALCDQFGLNEGTAISSMLGQFPIVIGMRLKATNYNEAEALLNCLCRCVAHEKAIKAIPLNKIHQLGNAQTPSPTSNKIIAISQLPTSIDQPTYYWVQASATVQNFNQKFWFMCCSKCNKGTDAEADDIFQCNYCKEKAKPEPRCKFDVQLRDSSGDITATIFGAQAENLFSINAQKWMESTSTVGQLSVETLATLYTTDEQIIQLRTYQFHTATTTRCKFNVNSVHKECLATIDHSTSVPMLPPPPKRPAIISLKKKQHLLQLKTTQKFWTAFPKSNPFNNVQICSIVFVKWCQTIALYIVLNQWYHTISMYIL
ncbi:Replication protein A 70 kDa DNA-binding subunit B [Camellia lanceoleosa]|uniref:Replication protein A 70 kDa DNA-binding subunit B n=1 Tax=Camellia lanceoleosa TaxID=1840588 RepID=A0ACC0I884_9ERIC|nr:Replication protein A 70 kDa DNA-binding subunit B [Camellia lanceoleosa]